MSGLITAFRSATDFDVAGIRVTTDAATEYEGGSRADLAADVRVEVEGALGADGTVLAREVEFKPEDDTEIEAVVEAVDATAGTFTLLGLRVATTTGTRWEDKRDDDAFFNLARLRVGDFVEVDAYTADGVLTAAQVERDDEEDTSRIEGLAEAVNRPELTVAGVTVRTTAETGFEGDSDAGIDADAFFAAAAGREVQADGIWNGSVLIAEEIELESD